MKRLTKTGVLPGSTLLLMVIPVLLVPSMSSNAQTVIHRCTQADGTIAFQETPCADPADDSDNSSQSNSEEPASANALSDIVNPFDEPEESLAPSEPAPPILPSEDRTVCEKATRDAIDMIEFEMRKGYTEEEGQQYLAELLEFTRQLRECKQL